MQHGLPDHTSELWDKNPIVAAAMLGALRENPVTLVLEEHQRVMLVERALRDQCRGDHAWLSVMVPRLLAGENILDSSTLDAKPPGQAPVPAAKVHPEITVSRPTQVSTQEELDDLLEMHRLWIKQVLEPGLDLGPGRANLKGCDLRAFHLEGADLRAAQLEACNLSAVSLLGANLAGANLANANLSAACLERARLRRSNLTGANLQNACLIKADLRHAQLKGAQLEGADLTDALGLPEKASPPPEPSTETQTQK